MYGQGIPCPYEYIPPMFRKIKVNKNQWVVLFFNLCLTFQNNAKETNRVNPSASGMLVQTPLIPINLGRMETPTITNTIPRSAAIITEFLASPKEVKKLVISTLKPLIKNTKA